MSVERQKQGLARNDCRLSIHAVTLLSASLWFAPAQPQASKSHFNNFIPAWCLSIWNFSYVADLCKMACRKTQDALRAILYNDNLWLDMDSWKEKKNALLLIKCQRHNHALSLCMSWFITFVANRCSGEPVSSTPKLFMSTTMTHGLLKSKSSARKRDHTTAPFCGTALINFTLFNQPYKKLTFCPFERLFFCVLHVLTSNSKGQRES